MGTFDEKIGKFMMTSPTVIRVQARLFETNTKDLMKEMLKEYASWDEEELEKQATRVSKN